MSLILPLLVQCNMMHLLEINGFALFKALLIDRLLGCKLYTHLEASVTFGDLNKTIK